jgi:hypothetical protein
VSLPPPAIGPIHISDHTLTPIIHLVFVERAWTLGKLYHNGQSLADPQFPLTRRNVRLAFFAALLKTLGEQMEDVRFLPNPISGVTLTATHEGGISLEAITGVDDAWELKGATSSGWAGRIGLFRTILQVVGRAPLQTIAARLAAIQVTEARDMFATMIPQTGNSCLVGVLVADLKNGPGQIIRVVSASANMCVTKTGYTAHVSRSQGSQVHMEIFLLERLGALLGRMTGTVAVADVGILGLKTSKVVAENAMCKACAGTKLTELDGRVPSKVKSLVFDAVFLGP